MRRIPTLLEVERRHILNTLYLCGNNRTRTAKVLGLSVRGLRMKLHHYQEAGFAIPAPLTRNEICNEIYDNGQANEGLRKATQSIGTDVHLNGVRELPAYEAVAIDLIGQLISMVEAMTQPAQLNGSRQKERHETSS